jgi:hypothetical protein
VRRLGASCHATAHTQHHRLRSNSSCPSALSKALAAHQAIFDSHKIPPISWSDLSKRLHRLQADISAHPARLRAWSSAALADLTAARDADVADLARRTRHVDAATRLVGAAQEERRAARGRLREQLGAPWSAEEETFWTTLTALDGAEDAVCDVLLGLALYGFGSAG